MNKNTIPILAGAGIGYLARGLGGAAVGGLLAYLLFRPKVARAATFAPGEPAPGILQVGYDVTASQAAKTPSDCTAAGGVWIKTGLFGLGSEGVCTDPQKSSAGCAAAGGTWVGTGCQFPGDEAL